MKNGGHIQITPVAGAKAPLSLMLERADGICVGCFVGLRAVVEPVGAAG